jgi:hypothetical protein
MNEEERNIARLRGCKKTNIGKIDRRAVNVFASPSV